MRNPPNPTTACWSCGRATAQVHFCEHCGSLQPPTGDYFQYLGLPRRLNIDREDLEGRFYALSRRLHPDVFFQRSERERQLSLDAAALLNDAYRTLKHPAARAEYLLGLEGVQKGEQKPADVPPELLEEVFELNMALEQIRAGDQSVRTRLIEAKQKFEDLLEAADQALEAGFTEWDRTGAREALERISVALTRRSYVQNLLHDVNAALV